MVTLGRCQHRAAPSDACHAEALGMIGLHQPHSHFCCNWAVAICHCSASSAAELHPGGGPSPPPLPEFAAYQPMKEKVRAWFSPKVRSGQGQGRRGERARQGKIGAAGGGV